MLLHYKNDKWEELPTDINSENSTHVMYNSKSKSFSYFAIGSKVAAPEEVPEEEIAEEVAPTGEVVEEVPTELPPEKAKMPIGWIIIGAIIVAAVIGYVYYKKKKG